MDSLNAKTGQLQKIIIRNLKEYIVASGLSSGDIFPTEKELSDTLGVSRTAIREALKGLETLGIIEVRPGIGRFLKNFSVETILDNVSYSLHLDAGDFREILDIRICLELSFLERCLALYTDEDFSLLDSLLTKMEEMALREPPLPEEELIGTHTDFHLALYRNSGNKILLSLIRIFSTIQRNLTLVYRYKTQDRREFIRHHRDLLDSIRHGDMAVVRATLMEHFAEAMAWSKEEPMK